MTRQLGRIETADFESNLFIGEVNLLESIVEGIQRHVRNSSHVYRLSRIVFKNASDLNLTPDFSLLNVSMHLVMQV